MDTGPIGLRWGGTDTDPLGQEIEHEARAKAGLIDTGHIGVDL